MMWKERRPVKRAERSDIADGTVSLSLSYRSSFDIHCLTRAGHNAQPKHPLKLKSQTHIPRALTGIIPGYVDGSKDDVRSRL